jgi:hypothetical protein
MLTVPTAEGQAMFGRQYKSYDYFIVKHAVAVNDPRGDQVNGSTACSSGLVEQQQLVMRVIAEHQPA